MLSSESRTGPYLAGGSQQCSWPGARLGAEKLSQAFCGSLPCGPVALVAWLGFAPRSRGGSTEGCCLWAAGLAPARGSGSWPAVPGNGPASPPPPASVLGPQVRPRARAGRAVGEKVNPGETRAEVQSCPALTGPLPHQFRSQGCHPCPVAPWPASDLWLLPAGLLLGGRQPERDGEAEGPVPAGDRAETEEPDRPHPLPGQHLGLQCGWRRAPE